MAGLQLARLKTWTGLQQPAEGGFISAVEGSLQGLELDGGGGGRPSGNPHAEPGHGQERTEEKRGKQT